MTDSTSFFGSAIPSATFTDINDEVRGKVIGIEIRDQRDMDTGEILTWADGRIKQMAVVLLETHDPADEDDSGYHNLYVRGFMQNDIRRALRAVHVRGGLENGMWLSVRLDSIDEPRRRGMKGARHFEASVFLPDETPEWAETWPPKKDEAKVGHVETMDEGDSGSVPF
jgi:hypothetical protein